jgi:hypothetical protein
MELDSVSGAPRRLTHAAVTTEVRMNEAKEKARRALYAVRQPVAKVRRSGKRGSVGNDCAGRMRLRPARIGMVRSGLTPSRWVKFGSCSLLRAFRPRHC